MPSTARGLIRACSYNCRSTSSTIVRTSRVLDALVITKLSTMPMMSPTSRTTMSSPFLASAARAAMRAWSFVEDGSVMLLRSRTPLQGHGRGRDTVGALPRLRAREATGEDTTDDSEQDDQQPNPTVAVAFGVLALAAIRLCHYVAV